MTRRSLRRPLQGLAPVVLVLAAACTDSPVGPDVKPAPEPLASIECSVNVQAGSVACSYPEDVLAGSAIRTTRTLGGQDKYVKLTNYGNTFANDTFQTFVTVQNLLAAPLGTDGVLNPGVMVFFSEDPSNGVTVANPSGYDVFMGPNQPYFLYSQVLSTYEVSLPMAWRFAVPTGVLSFSFKVYVFAPQASETGNGLDAVWSPAGGSTNWFATGNWSNGAVPGLTNAVQIYPSTMVSNSPVLTANAQAQALRIGSGSSLDLGAFGIEVAGTVDAMGAISNGSVTMSGTGSMLRGTVPSLFVTGSTTLQGSTRATGAVSVTGSLTVADSALSISLP